MFCSRRSHTCKPHPSTEGGKSIYFKRTLALLCLSVALSGAVCLTDAKEAQAYTSTASYYGPGLYGNYTASGDVLDYYDWTAAHKTLPLGTTITICYATCAEGVVITDRGPYVAGRDLDMTEYVASAIGFSGLDTVEWWVDGYDPYFAYYQQY